MSDGTRPAWSGAVAAVLALVLLVFGLVMAPTVCDSLTPDGGGATSTTEESVDAALFVGSWDGTYTALTAWDDEGPVTNPPLAMNRPMGMHLELHPWSDDTQDYGEAVVGGFSNARVTALTFAGAQVQLSMVSSAAGSDDYHSVFTLTLAGDTLSGEDSGDPAVPPDWLSTSGAIVLTRTGPWEHPGTEGDGPPRLWDLPGCCLATRPPAGWPYPW
jgi:hypothetical protein